MEDPDKAFGVIDLGSNAVRIGIAKRERRGEHVWVDRKRAPLRLGRDVFGKGGRISAKTLTQAKEVFCRFRSLLEEKNVQAPNCYCGGTSAFREAANKGDFKREIQVSSGITIQEITEEEEAKMVFEALKTTLPSYGKAHPLLLMDLGGGSTEIDVVRGDHLEGALSFPIGSVRLLRLYELHGEDSPEVKEALKDLKALGKEETFILVGLGGNFRKFLELKKKCLGGEEDFMRIDEFHALSRELRPLPPKERMRIYALSENRAQVIGAAFHIVETLLEGGPSVEKIYAPKIGLMDGMAQKLMRGELDTRDFSGGPSPWRRP